MKKSLFVVLAIVMVLMMAVVAFADEEPIKIGISMPITGPSAEGGLKQVYAAEIARDMINENGGINGRPVELVVLDDAADAAQAATVAQELCDDEDIVGVVVHSGSAISAVTEQIFEENKMANLHPASSVDALSSYGYVYFIRNGVKSSALNPMIASYIVGEKPSKIGLLYQNSDGGADLSAYAHKVADAGFYDIVYEEKFNSGTEVDFSTLVTKLMSTDAELLWIFMNYTEGGTLLKQMLDMGCDIPVVADNWLTYTTTIEIAGAEGCKNLTCIGSPSPFTGLPITEEFLKRFAVKYGEGAVPNGPALDTFDAVMVIAQALEQGATKENLAQWIKNMDNLHEEKFVATNLINDTMSFDETGEIEDARFGMIRVNEKGEFYGAGWVEKVDFGF